MSLNDYKIREADYTGKDVASLPDEPSEAGMSAAELKAAFDKDVYKRQGDGGAAGETGASGERARGSRAIADMGAGRNDHAADRRRTGRTGERRDGKEGRVEQRREKSEVCLR